jgi:hypothetical protein
MESPEWEATRTLGPVTGLHEKHVASWNLACYSWPTTVIRLSRLSHDASQPTLPDRHESSLTERIRALGFVEAAALAAFEISRDEAAPIGPTLRLTFALAQRLREKSILRLLEPAPRAPAFGQARAIYDPVAWEYLADPPELGVMRSVIEAQLQTCAQAATGGDRLWLWTALADAELEAYAAHLLRRHQMDAAWVRPIFERAGSELAPLSLAQKRALIWYGVREGAASYLRTRGDGTQCVDAVVCELRRQARWMLRHEPKALSWLPQSSWRQPLLLTIFLAQSRLGQSYWTQVPSLETLGSSHR